MKALEGEDGNVEAKSKSDRPRPCMKASITHSLARECRKRERSKEGFFLRGKARDPVCVGHRRCLRLRRRLPGAAQAMMGMIEIGSNFLKERTNERTGEGGREGGRERGRKGKHA